MKVLLVGMRGLGVETAKNLILAGPKSVDIYDPTVVKVNDLGSNFYIREAHVGKVSRAEASVSQLKELNSNVKVNVIDKLSIEDHANYHVVCYTENLSGFKNIIEANSFCHSKAVGFILCENLGLLGYAFTDFGDKHGITDADGEQCKSFMVVSVSQEEQAVVTVHEDKRHTYQEGDHVKFVEVEGMTMLNKRDPIEITRVLGPFSFKIDLDTRQEGQAYTRQGLVENVKVTKDASYHPLAQSYLNPQESHPYGMLDTPDLRYWGRSDQLHIALRAIHEFHTIKGVYPDFADADEVVALAKKINEKAEEAKEFRVEELDEAAVKVCAMFAQCSIVPQAAFFGGIIAQEIVKFTGKYSPLKQWLHYDIAEAVDLKQECNREPMNCRYDDQIKIFGREVQEKLGNIKTFMVGAGALGCEYMKTFALMGLGCGPEGEVHCTDNDNIEVSNLNRQFLFRQNHVTKSKSQTACGIAKEMNPLLNVTAYTEYVAPETEEIFNDKFWEKLDFIVNAVDNIKARLYVDQKCVWYEKPLLESGTLGTKANSQMVVPHKTKCYGDSQDPPEEGIPMCTLRNFPNLIEHCIEWGRESFNQIFVDRVQDTVNFIDNPDGFLKNLRQNTTSSGAIDKLKEVCNIINLKVTANYESCMQVAREYFDSYFDHQIKDLLGMFPPDAKTKEGSPFWSGPKRCPNPAPFDIADDEHFQFVWACANLIAFNLNIEQVTDRKAARDLAGKTSPKPYKQQKIVVETPEEAKEREAKNLPPPTPVSGADDEERLGELMTELKAKCAQKMEVQAIEFEKDDETNFHIDYIHATAQIRARNY